MGLRLVDEDVDEGSWACVMSGLNFIVFGGCDNKRYEHNMNTHQTENGSRTRHKAEKKYTYVGLKSGSDKRVENELHMSR